jgi:RHS repeat-associated protein
VTRTKSITASLTDSLTTTMDGLGRPYRTQHATPNGAATVATQYDGLDHVISVTNPYFSTSDSTYGVIQTQYDALGRVTQISEQDGGLKTVTYNVAPIGNAVGDCTTTTDEIGNQKQSCIDALGHITALVEHNPTASTIFATGSVSINGTEQTATSQSATSGSGTVTISGVESYMCLIPRGCSTNTYTYDSGTVWIQVGSYPTKTVTYGRNSTPATVAWNLSCAFHNDTASPVDAPCPPSPGTTVQVNFTARGVGASTNYSFSVGSSTNDTTNFGAASFDGSPTSGVFTGGQDASTTADTGTVSITINGTGYSTTYGASDTSATIAARLATAVSGGAYANASASGNGISLISKTGGSSGDYSLSASDTYDSAHFAQPSFTTSTSGANLTGGDSSSDIANAPYVTLYQYNARGDLLCVHQKATDSSSDIACTGTTAPSVPASWRQRFFTYDSLSRLLTANNPESGTVSYSYDADGNLLQKTSPAPNQTGSTTQTISYCYDELNRITGKAYSAQTCQGTQLPSGTAVVSYVYDQATNAKGKLTSLVDQAGSATFGYDVLNRLATEQRTLNGTSKTVTYEYNLNNSLKVLHYPSGNAITYAPDSAGRDVSAIDSGNGINYATAATYDATNALTGFVSGNSGGFAGITNTFSYNKRLQPIFMSAATSTQTVFSIGYDFHLSNGDNGNLYALTNNKDNTRNQTFTYDALDRLNSAQNSGTDCNQTVVGSKTKFWGNSYGYDAWGNLLSKSVTKCSAENLNESADAQNRMHVISGPDYSYDAAGNMTHDATSGNNYSYDAENRITAVAGYTYNYDGDGNRVEKSNGSTGTLYWYMTPGIVAESDLTGNLQSEYVFFDSTRIARKDFPSNAVSYYFSDNLKTASVIADSSGNIKSESDYYAWGGELQFINNDSNHYKFTGKERDTETSLDYFGARYYSNALGRFITPDWSLKVTSVPYADFGDPQTLNLYQYVKGMPTTRRDADGHCYPLCTVAAGAGIGFLAGGIAEIGGEILKGEKLDSSKILKAGVGGAITGAISGLAGPEAGLALRIGANVVGSVVGGGAERALTGEKVVEGGEILKDAGAGVLGVGAEGAAERNFATQMIKKTVPIVIETMVDGARRSGEPKNSHEHDSQQHPAPPPNPNNSKLNTTKSGADSGSRATPPKLGSQHAPDTR